MNRFDVVGYSVQAPPKSIEDVKTFIKHLG